MCVFPMPVSCVQCLPYACVMCTVHILFIFCCFLVYSFPFLFPSLLFALARLAYFLIRHFFEGLDLIIPDSSRHCSVPTILVQRLPLLTCGGGGGNFRLTN